MTAKSVFLRTKQFLSEPPAEGHTAYSAARYSEEAGATDTRLAPELRSACPQILDSEGGSYGGVGLRTNSLL